ncbi:MAG: sulfatase-like hydrolase/transferase [Bacteroidales bacterium]|nr:sulfatase-like hydrolase/transferase [Bacteroidales bacterium]
MKKFTRTSLVLSLAFALFGCKSNSEPNSKPNIIVILADDMGYSDLGCMGSEISTPNLDQLASRGSLFTEMHNTAKCYPTRASLLSGKYFQQTNRDFDNTVLISEILKENGYNTFWSGKHHATFDPRTRGGDRFYGFLGGAINYINPGDAPAPNGKMPALIGTYTWILDEEGSRKPFIPDDPNYYSTDAFTDKAIKWIDESKNDEHPFFMYVAFNAPHWPLQAKKEDIIKYKVFYKEGYEAVRNARYKKQLELEILDSESSPLSSSDYLKPWEELSAKEKQIETQRMQVYAAMIDNLDQNVGRIITKLEDEKELDNTIIFFLSDNGACAENPDKRVIYPNGKRGPIGEVDSYESIRKSWGNVANTPLRYYKTDSYAGGIRTPMIVFCGKNIESKSQISSQRIHLIDLLPTILSLTKSSSDKYADYIAEAPGIDFSPSLNGVKIDRNGPLFFQFNKGKAIIEDGWKLVSKGKGEWELYDLENDKTETTNLSESEADKFKELKTKWETWFAEYEYSQNKR